MTMFKPRNIVVPEDGAAMLADAIRRVEQPSRRAFLQRSLTLGGLSLLTGYTPDSQESSERALASISRFNDRAQAALFDPTRLAPTYPDSMITRPFPFNAYYDEDEVRVIDADTWRLELSRLIADREPWTLAGLRAMPQQSQIGLDGDAHAYRW